MQNSLLLFSAFLQRAKKPVWPSVSEKFHNAVLLIFPAAARLKSNSKTGASFRFSKEYHADKNLSMTIISFEISKSGFFNTLPNQPHPIDIFVKTYPPANHAEIGKVLLRRGLTIPRLFQHCPHQRPCSRADIRPVIPRRRNPRNCRSRVMTRRRNQHRVAQRRQLRQRPRQLADLPCPEEQSSPHQPGQDSLH